MSLDPEFVRERLTAWRPAGALYRPDTSITWMNGGGGPFFAMPSNGSQIRLFLAGRDTTVRSRIGMVTLDWTDRPRAVDATREPLLDLGEAGTFDMDGVSYPWLVERDGALFMYYVGWNRLGGDVSFRVQIGLAISEDGGRSFKRASRAPLLPLTDDEPIGSASMCVEKVAGGWRMLYTSFLRWERTQSGPRHYYHIREAYSKDGIHWERSGKILIDLVRPHEYVAASPVLDARGEKSIIYFTARGDRYQLFAAAQNAEGFWDRLPGPLEIHRGDFDTKMQCYPRILRFNDRTYLLYCGDGYGRSGIGYAEWMGR